MVSDAFNLALFLLFVIMISFTALFLALVYSIGRRLEVLRLFVHQKKLEQQFFDWLEERKRWVR